MDVAPETDEYLPAGQLAQTTTVDVVAGVAAYIPGPHVGSVAVHEPPVIK